MEYRCNKCGSTEIQIEVKIWIDPNENRIVQELPCLDNRAGWCCECQDEVAVIEVGGTVMMSESEDGVWIFTPFYPEDNLWVLGESENGDYTAVVYREDGDWYEANTDARLGRDFISQWRCLKEDTSRISKKM